MAGSHGKTTTTTMIAVILAEAGLDPTAVIGGKARALRAPTRASASGEILVAEADESDGSFRHLFPTVAVVTNIDREHLDHFGTEEALSAAFFDFADKVPFYGLVVIGADNPGRRRCLAPLYQAPRHLWPDGGRLARRDPATPGRPARASASACAASLHGEARVRMPGVHHAGNALAALCVADFLGVPFATAGEALAAVPGRRSALLGARRGRAACWWSTTTATTPPSWRRRSRRRALYGRRLVVAFQPHRFTRTRDLLRRLRARAGGRRRLFAHRHLRGRRDARRRRRRRRAAGDLPRGTPVRKVERGVLAPALAEAGAPRRPRAVPGRRRHHRRADRAAGPAGGAGAAVSAPQHAVDDDGAGPSSSTCTPPRRGWFKRRATGASRESPSLGAWLAEASRAARPQAAGAGGKVRRSLALRRRVGVRGARGWSATWSPRRVRGARGARRPPGRTSPTRRDRGQLAGVDAGDQLLAVDADAVAAPAGGAPLDRVGARAARAAVGAGDRGGERHAVASALLGALYLLDADGRPFKRATFEEADGLPVITGVTREQYAALRPRREAVFREAIGLVGAYGRPAGGPPPPSCRRSTSTRARASRWC